MILKIFAHFLILPAILQTAAADPPSCIHFPGQGFPRITPKGRRRRRGHLPSKLHSIPPMTPMHQRNDMPAALRKRRHMNIRLPEKTISRYQGSGWRVAQIDQLRPMTLPGLPPKPPTITLIMVFVALTIHISNPSITHTQAHGAKIILHVRTLKALTIQRIGRKVMGKDSQIQSLQSLAPPARAPSHTRGLLGQLAVT